MATELPISSFPRAIEQLHGFIHSANIVQDLLFVTMPSREAKNGQFRDMAHPINDEFRMSMESLMLDKYYSVTNQARKLVSSEIHTEDVAF